MKYTVKQDSQLLEFLVQHYSRKNAKNYLKYKQVLVNNEVVTKFDHPLKQNDIVAISQQKDNNSLDIIYEDDEIIVINKPAGLLSMSDGKEKEKTAYHLVSEYVKKKNRNNKVFIVHRLDQDTSGVLMFSKSEKLKHDLQENWNDIVETRGYIALVEGHLKKKHGTIKNYLAESKTQKVYIGNSSNGKLAITHYRVIKETKYNSLVEIFLDTGRKNQIRVHMESLGHSIVGDKKYGARTNSIKRLGLHANVFEFEHPYTKQKMKFVAKTPQSLLL